MAGSSDEAGISSTNDPGPDSSTTVRGQKEEEEEEEGARKRNGRKGRERARDRFLFDARPRMIRSLLMVGGVIKDPSLRPYEPAKERDQKKKEEEEKRGDTEKNRKNIVGVSGRRRRREDGGFEVEESVGGRSSEGRMRRQPA